MYSDLLPNDPHSEYSSEGVDEIYQRGATPYLLSILHVFSMYLPERAHHVTWASWSDLKNSIFSIVFHQRCTKCNKLAENGKKSKTCQWCYNTAFPYSHGKDSVFLPLLLAYCPGSALERWRLTRWPAQFQGPSVRSTLGSTKQQNKARAHSSGSCLWAARLSWQRLYWEERKLDQSIPQQDCYCRPFCVHLYLSQHHPLSVTDLCLLSYSFLIHVLTCRLKVSKHFLFVFLTQTSFKH